MPSTREVVANAIQECAVRAKPSSYGDAEKGTNGYSDRPSYNLDGADEDNMEEAQQPRQPQSTGQPIDLLSLFNKPPVPSVSEQDYSTSQPRQPFAQPSRFGSTADTNFFRTSHSSAQPQQNPTPQQNALLDLFKSAKRG